MQGCRDTCSSIQEYDLDLSFFTLTKRGPAKLASLTPVYSDKPPEHNTEATAAIKDGEAFFCAQRAVTAGRSDHSGQGKAAARCGADQPGNGGPGFRGEGGNCSGCRNEKEEAANRGTSQHYDRQDWSSGHQCSHCQGCKTSLARWETPPPLLPPAAPLYGQSTDSHGLCTPSFSSIVFPTKQ